MKFACWIFDSAANLSHKSHSSRFFLFSFSLLLSRSRWLNNTKEKGLESFKEVEERRKSWKYLNEVKWNVMIRIEMISPVKLDVCYQWIKAAIKYYVIQVRWSECERAWSVGVLVLVGRRGRWRGWRARCKGEQPGSQGISGKPKGDLILSSSIW